MAKLPNETLTEIFTLQRLLIEGIHDASVTEAIIFEQYGETELTLPVLEQLQNSRERLLGPYSRLCALLPRIAQYQPTPPRDVLDLLYRAIEQAQATYAASEVSVREARGDFNISL
ncbi:MAG: hypothetical protein JOZ78_17240 [Chroococcidiopsidaceae cyanobacterium CP_BM_ER_R8_30]|nr:hypothetical protein [Chroococcidiopsidaceae cyanobacterium CP_BM_ER_R8_30]